MMKGQEKERELVPVLVKRKEVVKEMQVLEAPCQAEKQWEIPRRWYAY